MSVVIKGMDLPSTCYCCRLAGFFSDGTPYCSFTMKPTHLCTKERDSDCPLLALPEKHGRLIDADELMKVIQANDYTLVARHNTMDRGMFTIGIKQAVDETPTILEAK